MDLIKVKTKDKTDHHINPEQIVSVEYTPSSSHKGEVPDGRGGDGKVWGTVKVESAMTVRLAAGDPILLSGQEADALAATLLPEPNS